MKSTALAGLRRITFEQHAGNGVLTVYPANIQLGIPFAIARVFIISGVAPGGVRGEHAHRHCTQLFACLSGHATVHVTDGQEAREEVLDSPADGLLVPPGLWTKLTFRDASSVVAVFCDQQYDERDYIRNWDDFLRDIRESGN